LLRRQKAWTAGALIALSTAIKAFPVLAIGYLVYRRYWKATISTLAFLMLFLIAVPAPFRGFDRNLQDLKTWTQGMTRYEAGSISQREQRGFSWANHSLVAVAHRLLRPVNAHRKKDATLFVNVADLDFRQVTAVILIAAGGLCLLYIICMPTQKTELIGQMRLSMPFFCC
jgi:Glycosyltransferase family 87